MWKQWALKKFASSVPILECFVVFTLNEVEIWAASQAAYGGMETNLKNSSRNLHDIKYNNKLVGDENYVLISFENVTWSVGI